MVRDLLQSIAGYPGLLLACIGSGLVVPLPEDFPLLYAGAKVATDDWSFAIVLAIGMFGVGLRDAIAWGIGRVLGDAFLWRPNVRRFLGGRKLDRAGDLVRRHGAAAVLVGRFMVGFRAPVFVVAGATGVPLRAFLVYDAVGLVIVIPLTVLAGWVFGEPLAELVFWGLQRARIVVAVLLVGIVAWGVWRWISAASAAPTPDDEPA